MGYNTCHRLDTVSGKIPSINEIIDKKARPNGPLAEEFLDWVDTEKGCLASFEEPVHWYDREEHLKEFSKKHPETLFILSGEGEDYGDLWKFYVKNGKGFLANAEIVYPAYDEILLK